MWRLLRRTARRWHTALRPPARIRHLRPTYELSYDDGTTWDVVTCEAFAAAEKAAGFNNRSTGRTATGGFGVPPIRGRVR